LDNTDLYWEKQIKENYIRKSSNMLISPMVLRKARIEARIQRINLGEWLLEAIDEKVAKE